MSLADGFRPGSNSICRKMLEEIWWAKPEAIAEIEAELYVDAFIEGANQMKEQLEGMRNPPAGSSLPYLDAVPLNEAVLCESCKFITRVQTETCPMCGTPSLTDLSQLISPLDAVKKEN